MFAFVPAVLSVSGKNRSQRGVFLWPFSIFPVTTQSHSQGLGEGTVSSSQGSSTPGMMLLLT